MSPALLLRDVIWRSSLPIGNMVVMPAVIGSVCGALNPPQLLLSALCGAIPVPVCPLTLAPPPPMNTLNVDAEGDPSIVNVPVFPSPDMLVINIVWPSTKGGPDTDVYV